MKKVAPFFLGVVLVALGCSKPWEKEITEITSWQAKLDSAEIVLNSIDSLAIAQAYSRYESNVRIFKKMYKAEQVDTTLSRALAGYKGIRSVGKNLRLDMIKIREELAFTRKNLEALKEKMERDELAEDTAKAYFEDERAAVGKLIQQIEFLHKGSKAALDLFYMFDPYVSARADSLLNAAN